MVSFLVACGYAPPAVQTPASQIPSYPTVQQPAPQTPYPQTQQPGYPYVQQPGYQIPPVATAPQPTPSASLPSRSNNNDDDDDDDEDDDDEDEDQCRNKKSCVKRCKAIYKSSRDETRCGRLSEDEVEDLEDVFEVLEDPTEDDLEDLDVEDLKKFLKVSNTPLERESNRYSSADAKAFLFYIAENDEVAEVLRSEDSGFEILDNLLEELDEDTVEALVDRLGRGNDSFMETIIEYENLEALAWVHEYLEDGTNGYNANCNGNDRCIFDKYCRMADELDASERRDLYETGDFEDFLEDDVNVQQSEITNDDYGVACEIKTEVRAAVTGNTPSPAVNKYEYRVKSWTSDLDSRIDQDVKYLIWSLYPSHSIVWPPYLSR